MKIKLFLIISALLLTTPIFAENNKNTTKELKPMTNEEMIERAKKMRSRVTGPVKAEEFVEFPAEEKELSISTRQGDAKVFLITSEKNSGEKLPLIINIHGGGFIKGRADRDKLFCSKLVNRLPVVVLDIDYKLAPENKFPKGLEETHDVVQWAFENADKLNIDPERVAVIGQSAGGNLAVGAVNLAIDKNGYMPKALITTYAPLDLHTDPVTKRQPEGTRPGTAERARVYNSFYVDPAKSASYLASPVFTPVENLKVFPKSLIISAGKDMLADESEAFAINLAKAGVEVTAKRFIKSPHGFTINRMGEYQESIDLIVKFLKDSL